jgi:hypothetical protein
MPDLTSIGNLVVSVLIGLVIWTMVFDPGKETVRAKLVVYYAGVAFALIAGSAALLVMTINLIKLVS